MKNHIIIIDCENNTVSIYELPENNMQSEQIEEYIIEHTEHRLNSINWMLINEDTEFVNETNISI